MNEQIIINKSALRIDDFTENSGNDDDDEIIRKK